MDQANGVVGELTDVAEHTADTRKVAIRSVKSKDSETSWVECGPSHLWPCDTGDTASLLLGLHIGWWLGENDYSWLNA